MDMIDHTLRVADEGLSLFPKSEELRKLRQFARKTQLNREIKRLRAKLNKGPNPALYKEIADHYLELGDFGAVHGIAEECIRRFPKEEGAYLVLAKARLTNFYRDVSARDGLEAVRNLEKVVELDPKNVKAHRLLGEVYYRIGSVHTAVKHMETVQSILPGDREAEALIREAKTRKHVIGTLEELFHKLEARGSLPNSPVSAERAHTHVACEEAIGGIRDSLAQLVDMPGVVKACYIKGSKAMVKGEIRDGKDVFMRVVRVVTKAARRVCRRMDLGTFSKGTIDGDFGHICVCSFGEVVAAVLCDPGVDVNRILDELQELVAGSLYMSGREHL
jgi:tetratricopeptide (TPR) repeat protein